jgi:hypothetical protein
MQSLDEFQRNTQAHLERLRRSGKPEILTVNGQPELVVQSAVSYQKLLQEVELLETLKGIRRGWNQAQNGEGRPMREFLKELVAKDGVELCP